MINQRRSKYIHNFFVINSLTTRLVY